MDAVKFVDLARNLTVSEGLGNIVLGAPVAGFQNIAAAVAEGEQFYYAIQGVTDPTQREVGRGTMLAAGNFARTAPVGAPTDFGPGVKNVSLVVAAKWFTDAMPVLNSVAALQTSVSDIATDLDSAQADIIMHTGQIAALDAEIDALGASGNPMIATRAALAALPIPADGTTYLVTEDRYHGLFKFSTADLTVLVTADPAEGVYVAPDADADGSSGAWVRQYYGALNVQWFGTHQAAFVACQNFVGALARPGYAYNNGVPSVWVPFGVYDFVSAFDVVYPIRWVGEGADISNAASVLKWNNTSNGLRVQFIDTVGDAGTQAPATHSGSGATFENLHFEGGWDGLAEAERHAVLARAACRFRRCNFFNWAGDALHVWASTVAAFKGNANLVLVEDSCAQNCRNGWSATGNDDVNACDLRSFNAIGCRQAGIYDISFLGNKPTLGHLDANARQAWNTGAAGRPCSYVFNNGHVFFCIYGQEAGASVNSPPATATDNAYWGYWKDQGAADPATGVPQWFNGIAVRPGGPFIIIGLNNASTVTATHVEINGVSQVDQQVLVLGASTGEVVCVSNNVLFRNRVRRLAAVSAGLQCGGNFLVEGGLFARGADNFIGLQGGAAVQDSITRFGTRSTSHEFQFQVYDAAGAVTSTFGTLLASSGLGWITNFVTHRLRVGGADMLYIDAGGCQLKGPAQSLEGTVSAPADNTSGMLLIGRYNNAGIPYAVIKPVTAAFELQIRSMDNSTKITVTDAGVDFPTNPSAPTPAAGNNSTKLATTAFVQAAIAALINGAPGALDQLNELATAMGNDPAFATTMINALAAKMDDSQATAFGLSVLGAANAAAGTALFDVATQALKGLMSAQDKTRLDNMCGPYVTVIEPSGSHIAGRVAGTYGFGHGDPLAITGTGTLYPLDVIYLDPADYPAIGTLANKFRLRCSLSVNDTAPTGNFTLGLHPITRPASSGAAGLLIYTIGAAVAGSTAVLNTPAADSTTNMVSADFAMPAAGHYCIGFVTTATVAVNSHLHMSALLQRHYA